MHVPRDEQNLSATERLTAIAELFTRGIQRWLATKRGAARPDTGHEQALPTRKRSKR
jgi:hypothetical protein